MKKKWWFLLIFLVLVGGGVAFFFLQSSKPVVKQVMTAVSVTGDMHKQIYTTGKVQSKERQTLFSPNTGSLSGFQKQVGDQVHKGEVVGYLDTQEIELKILEKEHQLFMEQNNLTKLQTETDPLELARLEENIFQEETRLHSLTQEMERLTALLESGATTRQEVEKKQVEINLAESAVKVAKQNLEKAKQGPKQVDILGIESEVKRLQREKQELERERGKNKLIAPADGVISSLEVKNGQYLTKGTEIFTVINPDNLEIVVHIPESEIGNVQLGQEGSMEAIALGQQRLKVAVAKISPLAEVNTEAKEAQIAIKVFLDFLEESSLLMPGMQVDVNIVWDQAKAAVQVPFDAIQVDEEGKSFVWVVEEGRATKRLVETGLENELFTQVKSGLQLEEKVILNPQGLIEGEEVRETTSLY